jgi:hypothetical protein
MTSFAARCSVTEGYDLTVCLGIDSLVQYNSISPIATVTMEVNNEWKRIARSVSGWNIEVEETLTFWTSEIDWTVQTTDHYII